MFKQNYNSTEARAKECQKNPPKYLAREAAKSRIVTQSTDRRLSTTALRTKPDLTQSVSSVEDIGVPPPPIPTLNTSSPHNNFQLAHPKLAVRGKNDRRVNKPAWKPHGVWISAPSSYSSPAQGSSVNAIL
ncbi:hypothetical protein BV898_18359 [Hypsibius exemplaris]|uniref:Uncharacterized protein n=1 Tax=Hypsibius exemplaris TaxID=2072580 RepID=A0A9X6NHE8_HYPEX|nr:hypothetical protein BV898_18359 [Hypsibius exemplaris]